MKKRLIAAILTPVMLLGIVGCSVTKSAAASL